jgi:hypothetical protein
MKYNKKDTVNLIMKKLNGTSFLSYKEIAGITGYHPKYILKLKKEIIEGNIKIEHGNKNKEPINKISKDEEQKIITLYKRSNTSIRKFCKFYNNRSYSCIYNVLKNNNLIK